MLTMQTDGFAFLPLWLQ